MDPRGTARAFVKAVDAGNAALAWSLLHPDYRATLAQRWLDENASAPQLRGHDLAALERAMVAGDERYADLFELYRLEFSTLWPRDHRDWGWASDHRPIAPGLELLLFTDAEIFRLQREAVGPDIPEFPVPAVGFYMRLVADDWLVAGLNEEPA
jgi:hypothetical protein